MLSKENLWSIPPKALEKIKAFEIQEKINALRNRERNWFKVDKAGLLGTVVFGGGALLGGAETAALDIFVDHTSVEYAINDGLDFARYLVIPLGISLIAGFTGEHFAEKAKGNREALTGLYKDVFEQHDVNSRANRTIQRRQHTIFINPRTKAK